MPVPTLVTDLNATIASNSPAGSDNVFPSLDEYLRAMSGFIASIRDNSGNGWVSPYATAFNPNYTGTLTGGTGVVNLGSGQFYKSATGDVGIGTASPASKLQVVGGNVLLDNTAGLAFKAAGGASTDAVKLTAADILQLGGGGATTAVQMWTAGAQRATIDASGNLGIGTASPGQKLEVAGTGKFNSMEIGANNSDINNAIANAITFKIQGAERMRIDTSGNLGLGVTPSAWAAYKAVQVGRGYFASDTSASTTIGTLFGTNSYYNGVSELYIVSNYATKYIQDVGQHRWLTAPSGTAGNAISFTQAMTLDASSRLLIGTTTLGLGSNGNTVLTLGNGTNTVYSSIKGSTVELYSAVNATEGYIGTFTNHPFLFYSNNTERARITSGGDLLVGKNALSASVVGWEITPGGGQSVVDIPSGTNQAFVYNNISTGATATISFRTAAVEKGFISWTNTATAYSTSSDYRLKDNPQPLTGSGAFIDALQPKTWDWVADGSRGVGFIAHEAQAVSPSSVVGEKDAVDEDGKPVMQAMEYGSAEFIANIIAELQSLRARVASLEVA